MPLTRMTLEERVRCIRMFSMYDKPSEIRFVWKKKFGTDPPSKKTIVGLNKKFNETGTVADLPRSGRPKSSRTVENINMVEEAIKNDPTKSLRTLSQDLGINKASIHRIKQESEKKNGLLLAENKRLKEKISEMSKKIELLEKRLSENAAGASTYVSSNNIVGKVESAGSSLGHTITTHTPVVTVDGHSKILLPHETFRLIEIQIPNHVPQNMESSTVEVSNIFNQSYLKSKELEAVE